jgi:hypothetical protein
MPYSCLIYIGFAVVYTWFVFRAPLGDDIPPIWTRQNRTTRTRIILVHSLFLATYLCVLCFLTWRESSFDWLGRGESLRMPGLFHMIFVGIFGAMLECLLLYRGPGTNSRKNENNSTKEN